MLKPEKYREISDKFLQAVRRVSQNLKKINSDPRWKSFKYEQAQGGRVTMNSVDEAIAGIACEEQSLINGPLTRSAHVGEEFIDSLGKTWDVKTAHSYSVNGKYIFDANSFVESVKRGYHEGENIILNLTNVSQDDLDVLCSVLKQNLTKQNLAQTIIVHAKDASICQKVSQLLGII